MLAPSRRERITQYVIATVLVGVTALLRWQIEPFLGPEGRYFLFFAPILLAAIIGGFGAGVYATLLAAALINIIFNAPRFLPFMLDRADLSSMVLFVAVGCVLSWLIGRLNQTRLRYQEAFYYSQIAEQRLKVLASISTILTSSLEPEPILQGVAEKLSLKAADRCVITMRGPEETIRAQSASEPAYQNLGDADAVLADILASNELMRGPTDSSATSYLATPIISHGETIGAMVLFSAQSPFTVDDESLIADLAHRTALVLENIRLFQANQQHTAELDQRVRERTDELESALRDLQLYSAKLAWSNRELEQFASVASHDLQEPLRKIQAFGDRLKIKTAAVMPPEGRDYIDRMQNAANRMQTLINDLLMFSRVTSKAQPFEPVDLNSIVKDVVGDLEARIEQTNATVTIGDLITVDADPLQIRQLLQNLLGNALKFHRHGVSPVITINGSVLPNDQVPEELPAGPAYVELTISDNGIGFDEKYLDRIFNVFQRLHGRSEYEGTGMGLAICRKIVERHNGVITARSVPGQGTTFIVVLPVVNTVAEERDTRESTSDHYFVGR